MAGEARGRRLLMAVAVAALGALAAPGWAVEIAPQADKSFLVTARTYRATVDAAGHFRSLQIGGVEFIEDSAVRTTDGAAPPAAAEVGVKGNVITASPGAARLRWTFDDTGINVETDGGAVEYRGWGRPPAETAEGLRVAAYFDPVNFAPDLTVPVVMDGGFYDNLAPAPGILAFANWAQKSPFGRCAIMLGGHGFFPPGERQRMEADLADFLRGKRAE